MTKRVIRKVVVSDEGTFTVAARRAGFRSLSPGLSRLHEALHLAVIFNAGAAALLLFDLILWPFDLYERRFKPPGRAWVVTVRRGDCLSNRITSRAAFVERTSDRETAAALVNDVAASVRRRPGEFLAK